MPQLLAVCIVHELHSDSGTFGATAIDKRAVDKAVKIGPYGARADVQVDRKHHGGLDQAIYAYSEEDAAFWSSELGRELRPGWFGENLRVSGVDVSGARIGERWRIGSGDSVVELEVTYPRDPCQTFARWVGSEFDRTLERGWVKRFQQAGRPGTYLRVVKSGQVRAGDQLEVVSSPAEAKTIAEVFGFAPGSGSGDLHPAAAV